MSRAREFADLAGSADAGGLTGRNLIINGAMQVAQRGTSQSSAGYGSIDRFFLVKDGTASAVSMSQQTSGNEKYADVTLNRGTASSGSRFASMVQKIEGTFICGKTVTISFDAWGSSADACDIDLEYYNGSSYSYATRQRLNFTTTRTRYSFTFTAPAFTAETSSSFVAVRWLNDASSGSSQSINLKLTNVQLELGDTATPFEHRSFGEELALCQRYFQNPLNANNSAVTGGWRTSSQCQFGLPLATSMRASPTMTHKATTVHGLNGGTNDNGTGCNINNSGTIQTSIWTALTVAGSPGTSGEVVIVAGRNQTQDGIFLDAEL